MPPVYQHRIHMKKVPIFSQQLLQKCTDFYNFWYTTLQMNTNHTGKFTALRAMYIPYLVT